MNKEEYLKSFKERKMTEDQFLENFYELKEEVSTNVLYFDLVDTVTVNIEDTEGVYKLQKNSSKDYFPKHLIDFIDTDLNSWAAPENRSERLKKFLELNDDTVK